MAAKLSTTGASLSLTAAVLGRSDVAVSEDAPPVQSTITLSHSVLGAAPSRSSEIKAVARQLFRIYPSLAAFAVGFTGTKTAPALSTAKIATTAAELLGRWMTTRSPRCTPFPSRY